MQSRKRQLRGAIHHLGHAGVCHPENEYAIFRVEDHAAVDEIARRFAELKIECSAPRRYPEYAPDYYAIFFSDPDGIRLEVTNYRKERRRRFEVWPNV